MRYSNTIFAAVLIAATGGSAFAASALTPEGIWISDNGKGAIEIKDCGGKMCGHLVWIKDPADTSRGCRKQILGDVPSAGGGTWDGGWVYSPERKKRYDVELKPLKDGTLRVMGYAGTKLFSKTMIWTKAPGDLVRCDTQQSAAVKPAAPETAKPATSVTASKPPATAPVETKAKEPVAASAPPAPISEPAKPSVALMSKPAPVAPAKPETAPAPAATPAPAPEAKADEPKTAQNDEAEDDTANAEKEDGDLIEKIAGMEFGNGYGLKKKANGECRLKVPYVTIDIPCEK